MLPRFRSHSLRPRSHNIAARACSFASPRDAAMSKRPSGEEQDSRDTPGVSLGCQTCRKRQAYAKLGSLDDATGSDAAQKSGEAQETQHIAGLQCSKVLSLIDQALDVWNSLGDCLPERLKVDIDMQLATTKRLAQCFEILRSRRLVDDGARAMRRSLRFHLNLTKLALIAHHRDLLDAHMETTRFSKINGGGVHGELWTDGITDMWNWTEVFNTAQETLLKRDIKVLCAACSDIEKLIRNAVSDMDVFTGMDGTSGWLSSTKGALTMGWATVHTAMFLKILKTHATDPAQLKSALQSEEKVMISHECASRIPDIILAKVTDGIAMTRSD